MKIFAYILIISSIFGLVVTDIIIEKSIEGIPTNQKMFETPKGRTAILSYLEAKDAALDLAIVTSIVFILLFVLGIALLLFNRIKKIERRLDKIKKG